MRAATAGLIILGIMTAAGPAQAQSAKEEAALKAAKAWLALVDAGKYEESWRNSAELFRSHITAEQWSQQVGAVRAPLGDVVSRTLKAQAHKTSLPGAPDGEYVVIQFATELTHKKSAVETITPMLDKDGTWRVSGYFIK
jgi:hypothetical protein